jgi:hypothetical protein
MNVGVLKDPLSQITISLLSKYFFILKKSRDVLILSTYLKNGLHLVTNMPKQKKYFQKKTLRTSLKILITF